MDEADPAFCRAVAKRLRDLTGRAWTARSGAPAGLATSFPNMASIPSTGRDRLAGIELLTPPLPWTEADAVRNEIAEAVEWMDGPFNFISSDTTADCGWHINIDATDQFRLHRPPTWSDTTSCRYSRGIPACSTPYTGLQRHAVGIGLSRHPRSDRNGDLLRTTGLANLLQVTAGRSKRYAANFAKLERGYLEVRHFSALSFFNGPGLAEQLDGILAVLKRQLRSRTMLTASSCGDLCCSSIGWRECAAGSRGRSSLPGFSRTDGAIRRGTRRDADRGRSSQAGTPRPRQYHVHRRHRGIPAARHPGSRGANCTRSQRTSEPRRSATT